MKGGRHRAARALPSGGSGGSTSTVSPAFSVSPTQLEKTPPAIRFTVTIQSCSSGTVKWTAAP